MLEGWVSEPTRRDTKFPLRLDQLAAPKQRPAPPPAGKTRTTTQSGAAGPSAARARPYTPPGGLGLDSADIRRRMVARLRAEGVASQALLDAMALVPRHQFVDTALVTQAYEDTSLPIGHGQTISKPSVVARMIDLLLQGANARAREGLGNTLEIGTGCGYQAAVLSCLARSVISVERLRALHDKARDLLAPMRSSRLRLVYGDGMLGHAPNAPYDSIIAAAGGATVPQAWLDQLAVGGRLISPVRQGAGGQQVLVVIDRTPQGLDHRIHEAVNFVPLKSGLI